ncbi:MAG: histidine--tRNA ligase [Planctomycetes bacterium]|nr:histidine--tRNA ligase [Planctomycetota bacterium]
MKIRTPPGMRDFYPADMRLQNWLFDTWRRVSKSFGFEEYEGPIFEFLDLYTLKSGEGIVSELFNFEDRGGRSFAIRPEMTPTLARMVAARANALPRPIKWFSIPRMCRAEKPQRGRLREFFQWNIDILGVDDVLADAEVIAVAVEFLRQVGLTAEEVVVRVSSRPIAAAALASLGIAPEQVGRAFALLDRADRLNPEAFAQEWDQEFAPRVPATVAQELLGAATLEHALALAQSEDNPGSAPEACGQFARLWQYLDAFGIRDYCRFDLKVVRGLAYYTGPVYEVSARDLALRALLGGGRYDSLTKLLSGPAVPATGFGMGDAPVLELLRQLDRLPEPRESLDVFVVDADAGLFSQVLEVVGRLRRKGLHVDFSYRRISVGKQFKQAAARRARYAIVVGSELAESGQLAVKDLVAGEQRAVAAEHFLLDPRHYLADAEPPSA